MKMTLSLFAAAITLAGAVHAQERTAGQNIDAQVNWGVLKNAIDLVNAQNKVLATTIEKMAACNTKGMPYVPGDAKADADGCLSNECRIVWNTQFPTCATRGCEIKHTDGMPKKVLNGTTSTLMNNESLIFRYTNTNNEGVFAQCLNGTVKFHGVMQDK